MHATLDQVAWAGGGFSGLFVSYKGMKDEAVAARRAAEQLKAAADAGAFQGKPGPPGPDTVPTQEAVAGYLKQPGNPINKALTDAVATSVSAAVDIYVPQYLIPSLVREVGETSVPDGFPAGGLVFTKQPKVVRK